MSTTRNTDTGDTIISTEFQTKTASDNGVESITASLNEGKEAPIAPREALITTAVNFLQNAKVRHTTLLQKQQFLRSKGLTMEEIQLACERAGVFSNDSNSATVINMGISSSQLALKPRQSAYGRIKEVLNSIALLSGVAYAIYIFWKQYLEPFLFGKKKKKPVDKALEDIDTKVDKRIDEVNRELVNIKDTMTQQQRDQIQQLTREFNSFRSDLEAIKGLLLNRKQFAAPLNTGPPSIPAWQLSSSPRHHHRHSQSDDNEKADDAGSGSGSSETEVVTKNSDSSLEIIEMKSD